MFETLSVHQLEKMFEAAATVSETMRVLQKSETNIVGEILKTAETFKEWEHIPSNDVYDRQSHSQYYYHAHSKTEDGTGIHDNEHGHFHTFIRGKGIPKNIKPKTLPDYDPSIDISNVNTHIIGIGMNEFGVPIRLFTVNRWVTGETWHDAEDIIKLLDNYEIDDTRPSWAMNLWMGAMIALFRPQIESLINQRDQTIAQWAKENPDIENVYEDRNLEVTSYLDINLLEHIENLEELISGSSLPSLSPKHR